MIEVNGLRRVVSEVALTLVFLSMLVSILCIHSAEAQNTIYIKSDGSVDPPTAPIRRNGDVYTLEGAFHGFIEVQKSSTTIDGNGFSLRGNGTGRAIHFSHSSNVTIKNMRIGGYSAGMYIDHSTSSTIINNTITNCTYGILPDYSPNTTIINNTVIDNKWDGIFAVSSPNSLIINNMVTNQGKWGVYLGACEGSTLRKNIIEDNRFNFAVSTDFVLDVDTSNKVDNKPIYYWINQRNRQVPLDAGYVAIVDSANIGIRNLNLKNNGQGVVLVNSENNIIENLNVTGNGYYGIYLLNSNFNTVRNNIIASNSWGGIALTSSKGNVVSNNIIRSLDKGVLIYESDSNTINNNTMKSNHVGPYLYTSSDNIIINNMIENNSVGIYLYESSNNNLIHHNNFVSNTQQAYVRDSRSIWDAGYPSGGNYWSDYDGVDANGDGIGDTPNILDKANADNYPFMNPVQKAWSQPQTNVDTTTIVSQMATVIIVTIAAYFLKRVKNQRSKNPIEPQQSRFSDYAHRIRR